MSTFKDLKVYQIGLELLASVEKLTRYLPRNQYREVDQIQRAAKSIIANIAEGHGKRRYVRELLKYLTNAMGSSDEVQVHLDILSITTDIDHELCEALKKAYKNLSVRLLNYIWSIKHKQSAHNSQTIR